MSILTTFLHLVKPLSSENYDVSVWNGNNDIIDEAVANRVIKNDNIQPGTATKLTYDAKGLVTGGDTLSPDDIPNLDISKITGRAPVLYIDGVPIYGSRLVDVDDSGNLKLKDDGSGSWLISVTENNDVLITRVVTPIADDLTTDKSDTALSSKMGKTLKTLIDTCRQLVDTHLVAVNNPHNVTKAQIGLGNADNTADTDKPISTATQTALNAKVSTETYTAEIAAVSLDIATHTGNKNNPHEVTKAQIGLGSVDNTADINKNVLTATKLKTARKINGVNFDGSQAITVEDATKIPLTQKGAASGVAELDANGLVPSAQLPSYVDDVIEGTLATFPATGETGKIYVDTDTDVTYRWSGTQYAEISKSLALGETSATAYAGNKGKQNATDIAALKTRATNVEGRVTDNEADITDLDTRITENATGIQAAQTDIQTLETEKADLQQDGSVKAEQLPYFNTSPTVIVDVTALYAVTFANINDGVISICDDGDYVLSCSPDGNVFLRPVTNKITDPVTGLVYRLDIINSQPILTQI